MNYWINIILLDAIALICQRNSDQISRMYIVSDLDTKIVGTYKETNAFKTQVGGWSANIPESTWIWNSFQVSGTETVNFKVSFALPGLPVSGILRIAFDDALLSVTINNSITGCKFLDYMSGSEQTCVVTEFLLPGWNIVLFSVQNIGGAAGLLYLLNISIAI